MLAPSTSHRLAKSVETCDEVDLEYGGLYRHDGCVWQGELGAEEAMTGITADADISDRRLPPVTHPKRWIAVGIALQVVGVGVPGGYLLSTAHREGIGGHITAATVRLAWRSDAHTTAGVVLLSLGLVVFGFGSMLMARPFVRRPITAFIAVPLAAAVGMLVLGFVALLVAVIVAGGGWLDIVSDWPFDGERRKRRKKQTSVGS